MLQRRALQPHELADAGLREIEKRVHLGARERRAFRGALHLDEAARARHHDVHVGVARGVFVVVEVEHRRAAEHADRDRRDVIGDRRARDPAGRDEFRHRVVRGDERARDARRARAAVGLDHVAIEVQRAWAERVQIEYRAQRAADQALNFLRSAGLLAARRFAVAARVRRTRQHPVFGGEPALAALAQEFGHALGDARRADHFRVAELDEHRAFRMLRVVARDAHVAQLVGAAPARA